MKVTVLMPAYNAERFIAEAIESVLSQTYEDFELIVIDDGSSDSTYEIAVRYARMDKRVKVISHANVGMGASLNKGLHLAGTELVLRMDADDVMMPNRIEGQVDFMLRHPDVAVASSLVYYINEQGEVIGKNSNDLKTPDDLKRYLSAGEMIGFHHPAVIMRKSVVLNIGGYRPQFWPADDIDLWIRIAERGYVLLVQQEYLLKYRIHGSSISVRGIAEARLKVSWVKECMLARRSGRSEPTWDEFLRNRRSKPLWYRVNQNRKDLAKVLYKSAIMAYASKNPFRTVLYAAGSFMLQPSYLLSQMRAKHVGVK